MKRLLIYAPRMASLAWLMTAGAAWPSLSYASANTPEAKGSLVRNTARMTFEWPQPVTFAAGIKGHTLTLRFTQTADPDLGPLLAQLYPYVQRAQRLPDGKTIKFTLDKAYRIRTYTGANVGTVELLNIDPKKRLALQDVPANAKALANMAPAAGPQSPSEPSKSEEALDRMSEKLNAKPQVASHEGDAAALEGKKLDDAGKPVEAQAPVDPNAPVKVSVSLSDDSAVIRMPFAQRVGLAVFKRGGTLWIVCSKAVPLDLSDFDTLPKGVVGKAETLDIANATVLRVQVDDAVSAAVTKEEASFNWGVLILPKKRLPANPLQAQISTEPPAPPHVFIPALEMAESVTLEDPVIGDTLVAVPLYNPGEATATAREFVEFSLLGTAQGIAIAKKADDVAVQEIRGGLRISLPQGTTLTPGLPQVSAKDDTDSLVSSATLFPYAQWKLDVKDQKARDEIRKLKNAVVETDDPKEANALRLRLAQVYLSEGMAPEAIGQLDGIYRTNPDFYRSNKLNALRGAANFLMYRFVDAGKDFGVAELNNNKEIDYWRSMISDLLGATGQTYDFLAMNPSYISKYPPLLRQRLAIVAADRSVEAKEFNGAVKIFDTLREDKLLNPIQNYVDFLLARISVETGDDSQAQETWDKLAEDISHPFVWSRAEFSRIVYGLDHNTITKADAIDRLERVRLGYHGDSLELKVLSLLGDLYAEKHDFINAMRIWDDGVTGFPNTATALEMYRKIQGGFKTMFSEGGADALPALKAVELYYQYHNYAPVGGAGTDVIIQLARRLESLDLMDQAAALLNKEMRYQTEKEQRSRLGVTLANIYLENRQPQKALQALQDSVYGENTAPLRALRNRITARALLDQKQADKAIVLLAQDDSPEAGRVRFDAYWSLRDWHNLSIAGEKLLKQRTDNTQPLSLQDAELVTRLGLAYAMMQEPMQLQYLRDYFGGAMEKSPFKPLFAFVTQPDPTPTPRNFDEVVRNLDETRQFVANYKARFTPAKAKATAPAPAAPATGSP